MCGFFYAMKKEVNCPICRKKVTDFDLKSANGLTMRCPSCGIYLLVKHGTGEAVRIDKPARQTASGTRFY